MLLFLAMARKSAFLQKPGPTPTEVQARTPLTLVTPAGMVMLTLAAAARRGAAADQSAARARGRRRANFMLFSVWGRGVERRERPARGGGPHTPTPKTVWPGPGL